MAYYYSRWEAQPDTEGHLGNLAEGVAKGNFGVASIKAIPLKKSEPALEATGITFDRGGIGLEGVIGWFPGGGGTPEWTAERPRAESGAGLGALGQVWGSLRLLRSSQIIRAAQWRRLQAAAKCICSRVFA